MGVKPKKMTSFLTYLKWGVPAYLVFCYIVLQILQTDPSIPFADRIDLGLLRIFQHPFGIFPLNTAALGILFFVGVIGGILLYVEYLRRKQLRPGKESGTSAWHNNLKAYNKVYTEPYDKPYANRSGENNKNIILTQDVFMGMDGRKTRRNLNVLVTGGSGSGKSRFVVKPNILQANCSFVVTDPKGELLESTAGFLRSRGYKIKVFNLSEMEHSCSYNPFHYIRDENGVLTMINALIQNTTDKNAQKGDPFWEKSETALLQAICLYLYYECKEEDRNFTNVMKLLRCAEVREGQEDYDSTLDIMFKDLKAKDPEHIAVRQYAIFKQAGAKTAQSILVTCSVRLTVFNMQTITRLTGVDNIDLASIGKEKTALFCITPVNDTTYNFLIAMLYTQLFETLYHYAQTECDNQRLPVHVRFLLDEFANVGVIPDFELKLSTMRSFEISCTIVIQNLAQLKTMYKDSWESITGNCDSFLFLGGQEQTTLEYVSKKLGKETIKSQNASRNFGGRGGGNSLSYNVTGRELMTADEISRMETNDCILFIRGEQPFFGKKYEYTEHPNYKYTGDADDNLKFSVHKEFNTNPLAKKAGSPYVEAKRHIKISADRSESRVSDKTERARREMHRKPRSVSTAGKPLYQDAPAEDTMVQVMAEQARQDRIKEIVVEEQLKLTEGYAPTIDEAFREFFPVDESEEGAPDDTSSGGEDDYGLVDDEQERDPTDQ